MTIFERALEFVADGMTVGLGSGRASNKFIEALGAKVKAGLKVRGVPSSHATAELAHRVGVPIVPLEDALPLDVTVDGADEVDPQLNLIKGYGRALLREKVLAAGSRKLVILVGSEKLVPQLGSRGKLPVEVVSFATPLCLRRLRTLGCPGVVYTVDGKSFTSDNGNPIIDCAISPMQDASVLERSLKSIPGVIETGLFLQMADVVLVGDTESFAMKQELQRPTSDEKASQA